MINWYPNKKEELNLLLDKYLTNTNHKEKTNSKINGIIVPHAGYFFSGEIAGKAYSLMNNNNYDNQRLSSLDAKHLSNNNKNKNNKNNYEENRAIILAPSHYEYFYGIKSIKNIKTPLGEVKIIKNDFPKLEYEHAINNQIPFLQKLGINEILPLVIGEISQIEIKKTVNLIKQELEQFPNTKIIISTDLSHFLDYENAKKKDLQTIEIISNLNSKEKNKIDACGKFPLFILIELCKENNWKPELIEYKNSGDITQDKRKVVGYASFKF